MDFDVKSLAARKKQETGHDEVEWLRALESARQSLKRTEVSYQSLEQIALASRSPSKFTIMTRLIYQYGKTHPHGDSVSALIFEWVDQSPFALSDWIDAIDYFSQWLADHQRRIDFLTMLKYLECCAASPDAQEGGQTFRALVEDMLHVCGYEG